MKKLNQIQFQSYIQDFNVKDLAKCCGLIILKILQKDDSPDSLAYLKYWLCRVAGQAKRFINKEKRKLT